jgi:isopenicillin-N epimerase
MGAAIRRGRTKVAIIDHITSPTAQALPVARLAAMLHDARVVVIVDGAHAPGMLPFRVDELGVDFWTGNLHKWAFAPRGTAALVVAARWRDRIQPGVVSWEQPNGFPNAVEYAGTLDYTPWLAAPVGLHLLGELGVDRVRQHNADLAIYGQRRVGQELGLQPADLPGAGHPLVSMRLVPLPPDSPGLAEGVDRLRERIYAELATRVPVTTWGTNHYIRLSAQIYNTPSQYDSFAEGVGPLILANGRAA